MERAKAQKNLRYSAKVFVLANRLIHQTLNFSDKKEGFCPSFFGAFAAFSYLLFKHNKGET